MVAAAGGLPGELHKLWRTGAPKGYHLEYGYSCMGYEIAGGLGVKLAFPDRRVIVLVGDGSYLMMNSEIATAVMMGLKLDIVVLDNRGFGCINRLQQAVGDRPFNNLLADVPNAAAPDIDFAAACEKPRRRVHEGRQHRRAGGRPRSRRRLAAHPCHRHRDRSRHLDRAKAGPGGKCRWPRSRRAARSARPMPPMPRRCCAANRIRLLNLAISKDST